MSGIGLRARLVAQVALRGTAVLRPSFGVVLALAFSAATYAAIGVGLQMQTGNPSSATTNPNNHTHYLISDRAQYAMDYNDTTRQPNWVAWDLTSADVGSSGRSSFIVDTTLPAGFYQVQTTDYSGSGYDRGHLCPSADRTVTAADNQIVFYMSNMMPQAPDNNQGVWASFETYCRTLASAGYELLIIAGPSGFGGSNIASGVAIPGYTWKIVVVVPTGSGTALSRITASTRVITIKIPNTAGVRSTPWQNFTVSVNQIETDTGYTFFDQLPAATAATLKSIVDGQTVAGAPVITGQPTAQTTAVGGNASFSVTATGNATLTYQWYKDDAEISGATNATLDLTNVTGSDAGNYTVAVTNTVGAATSNAAALIVTGVPPSITTSPVAQTVSAGSNVVFSVSAAGSPTLTYQWRRNGTPVSGGTSAVLTLTDVQLSGAYDVVVTNGDGTATSAAAALTVNAAAPAIATQPATQTTTGGANVVLSVVATGSEPMTFQWRKGGVNVTTGTVSSVANTSTLTLTNVGGGDAGTYDVVVTNGSGSATSNAATLTVNAATIYWDFATANPTSGVPADIVVGALSRGNSFGATPPALLTATSASTGYTGASGGNNAGVPARTGALNKVSDGSGSAYFEVILVPTSGKKLVLSGLSFGTRSTGTGPAAFSVFTSFDNFATAVATGSITPTSGSSWGPTVKAPAMTTVTGSTDQAITLRIYGHDGGGTASQNVANWRIDDLKITASTVIPSSAVAPAVVAVSPANGTNGVAVSSPISVTFNQAVTVSSGWFTITSATSGPVTATVTGGPITYTLTPPTNFTYGDTINVAFLAGKVTENDTHTLTLAANYSFSFNTGLPVAPAITTHPSAKSVAEFGSTTFTVAATGTAPLNYQWRKNGTPISGNATATNATLSLTNIAQTDAGSYDCVVSNIAGSATSNAAALTVTLVAPSIVTPPATRTIVVGGSTSFSVGAAGSAPLSYQWRKNGTNLIDGGGVTGSNTATLAIANATAASAGSYDVVVTNPVTSVTSSAAALNVTTATFSVVTWNFDSATTPADPSSGLPADLAGGTVTQGNNNGSTTLITNSSVSPTGSGFSGNNNAGAAARIGALDKGASGSAYFEFTLTPAAGKQVVATAISFGARSTLTGPQAYAVFSSADNFATTIATGTQPNTSAWVLNAPVSGGARGTPGVPLTFRIYGYNGTGSPGANTANWRIDDLKLTVGTELPPAVASTSPAANASGVLLNAPIAISFNQAVNATGTWASVSSAQHGPVAATITGGPTTYTVTPASGWSYGDTITVNVAAASVSDLSGTLAMPANYSFSFATVVPVAFSTPPASQTVTVGDSVNFSVVATGTAPLSYQWAKNGAPISGATSAGLALASVTTADAASYTVDVTNPAGTFTSPAAVLTVNPATPAVAWATPAPIIYGTALDAAQLNATASVPGTFAYSPATGSVLNAGLRTLSVTFTPTDTANYVAVTQTTTISVGKATPALAWTAPAPITYGTALGATQLAATANVLGSFAYTPAAGAVLNAGMNQALAVTFTPADTNNFTTASAGTTITVNKATPALTWTTPASIIYGTALSATQLNATATAGGTFAYTPAIGAVLNAGEQTLNATFTPSDAANYTTATASTTLTVNKATPTIAWGAPVPIAYGTALDGTQLNATASAAGSFAYAPAAGSVLAAGSQTLSATFTPTDTANYNGATASTTITVNKATPAITWPAPAAIVYGTALSSTQLNATADAPGSFAYSPDVGAILGAGTNTLNATFTPSDPANYNGATATRSLTVTPKPVVITLGSLAQTYDGTAKSATFTTDVAAAAAFVSLSYSPGSPLNAGSYDVTASLTGANYSGSASGTLVIGKATPVLAWAAPAAITYGTALGASQLNATANVAGSFAYTPTAGTVLNAGMGQALSASFTPANTANFNGGNVSTTITVNKATATVTLSNLSQPYDGTPKSATVTVSPTGLTVDVSYNGSPAAPTLPGSYAVIATVNDANYTGSATGTLLIGITAIVRHAPAISGDLDGSLQVLLPEAITLSGSALVSGDLLVPGLPTVQVGGHPTYGGTQDGLGAATPANYAVTLSGNAVLRHVVRRTDAIALPVVVAPPTSTQNVALAGNAGATALAPGNYGALSAGGSSSFVLGVVGATTPAVYNVQSLTLGGNATLQIAGPVVLTLANGVTLAGTIGDAAHPEWLTLAVANGGVTVSGGATFRGAIVAPNGTVTINGTVLGTVSADRLAIGGAGLLDAP